MYLTSKHILLATFCTALLVRKYQLISTFENYSKHNLIQLIKTVQVLLAQKMREIGFHLPIVTEVDEKQVKTYFLWRNFDMK